MISSGVGAKIDDEFRGAQLGDRRRVSRLLQLARALDEKPDASYPDATVTDAGLEGAYRLLNNEAASADAILAGHYEQTVDRAAQLPWVLAVHDTTIFEFSGDKQREGLGPLLGKGQGFFGHFTLIVEPGELRRPLGVLSLESLVRVNRRGPGRPVETPNERLRWLHGVQNTEKRLDGRASAVHVMDREADSYGLWANLIASKARFVIQTKWNRHVNGEDDVRISDVLENAPIVVERTVALSPRKQERIIFNRKRRPARAGRLAKLALSAVTVSIHRSGSASSETPSQLQLNVVRVREIETHGENQPVEWLLTTTEPISTPEEIERIVDAYRARWTIEEYFKAIKSGCAYEKRQLESIHALMNGLAIFVPIAWRLLLLRTLARDAADEPACNALTPTQLAVLAATARKPLPKNPTVRQAMHAIAGLGGHITNNGEPGWAVLARGFHKLLAREEGWLAAIAARSDQS